MINPDSFPRLTAADRADIQALTRIGNLIDHGNNEARRQTAATLAAGMIAASGRAHSPAEAVALMGEVLMALSPIPGAGRYKKWVEDGGADKVHT